MTIDAIAGSVNATEQHGGKIVFRDGRDHERRRARDAGRLRPEAAGFGYWQVWEALIDADVTLDAGVPPDSRLARDAQALRAELEDDLGRCAEARRRLDRAGDRRGTLRSRVNAAMARVYLGDLPEARRELEAAIADAAAADLAWEQGYAYFGLGVLHRQSGDLTASAECFERAEDRFRATADPQARAYALHGLAGGLVAAGRLHAARDGLLTALMLLRGCDDRYGMFAVLRSLPATRSAPASGRVSIAAPARRRTMAGPALAGGDSAPLPGLRKLTPRELQVADLLAQGLTNRQIGARIAITERTVDTHVQRILAKLECASRVQVALLVAGALPGSSRAS